MALDWNTLLTDQLDWHWRNQLRPRLAGLTDGEYFWEPVAGCWSLRPRDDGGFTVDWAFPAPEPAPVTTIAWRLNHILIGVLGARSAAHFGAEPVDYDTYLYPATATEALDRLDAAYAVWMAGVRGLGEAGLARPCGPAEGPYADEPMATLVLHIHRETIHHGAEISLLRDLYARQPLQG
ncbi:MULTISPECIES: DinB family protein [unclassified Streptomyces]|uniref:DinB family protein n=1 Tax=unclassified Streptomyces TaxID=2593676 RepID=UPI000DB93295|nr:MULTISPECIES: DinB family protein [unclassified Streptomyces]MYT69377.1 DinB family protein [Streptomyces sp. SID8367]